MNYRQPGNAGSGRSRGPQGPAHQMVIPENILTSYRPSKLSGNICVRVQMHMDIDMYVPISVREATDLKESKEGRGLGERKGKEKI